MVRARTFLSAALMSVCMSAVNAADIKIGVLLPLTGPLAALGSDVNRGFELARDLVNEDGGINGSKVDLVTADVPGSNEATSQANRLITRDKVELLMGSFASSISFAASQVAERNGVIYVEQGAVADDITARGFKNLFRFIYTATEVGAGGAEYAVDYVLPRLNIPLEDARIAIMYEDSSFGSAVAEGARNWLNEKNLNIVADSGYSYKTTDLSSIVQRLKSVEPDILIASAYTPDAILFWRQAREANLNLKAMVAHGGGHNMPEFAEALEDDVNGVFSVATSAFFNSNGLTEEAAELYDRFHKEYQERYERKPSAHSIIGFNAMWVVLNDVLRVTGDTSPDKVRQALLDLDKPVGSTVLGWGVKFDPETGDNTRAFPMVDQWQQKEVRTVYPAEFSLTSDITLPLPEWGQRADIGK